MIKTEIISPVKNESSLNEKENMCKLSPSTAVQNDKDKTPETKPISSISELKGSSSFSDDKENATDKQEQNNKVIANLACKWSTKKTICSRNMIAKGAVAKSIPPPPQAYLVKDIIQLHREEAERRKLEEEKKLREFHARPVPEFIYEPVPKIKPVHSITFPITPQVLKKSLESAEKRKKRLEEMKQKLQPPKFSPRSPSVLKKEPFVAKKKSPTVTKQCPFNLRTDKRLQEHKQYTERARKALEEKRKQEEEKRKRVERERIKEIRKAATFKARPNPYKN